MGKYFSGWSLTRYDECQPRVSHVALSPLQETISSDIKQQQNLGHSPLLASGSENRKLILLSVLQSIEYDSTKHLKFFTPLPVGRFEAQVLRLEVRINDCDYLTFSPSSSHPI